MARGQPSGCTSALQEAARRSDSDALKTRNNRPLCPLSSLSFAAAIDQERSRAVRNRKIFHLFNRRKNCMRLGRNIALTILLLFVFGCATVVPFRQPQITDVRPRIIDIDFQGVHLAVDVDVYNPGPFLVHGIPAQYGIDIKDKNLATGQASSSFQLPPHQKETVKLPLSFAYSDLARIGKDVAGASELSYTIHGMLRIPVLATHIDIPFSHEGKFPVLRPPALSAIKVQLTDVSLSKAQITADAEISNPNVFEVGINDLTYMLNLGNAQVTGLKASSEKTVAAGEKGRLTVSGEISAENGLINLLMNGISGAPEISASGFIQTPYGKIKL
jgi:LEA14-like dessication related protein